MRDLCPACHHQDHDPGSCEDCPRCELHTDDALDFVLRIEPSLLAERGYFGGADLARDFHFQWERAHAENCGGVRCFDPISADTCYWPRPASLIRLVASLPRGLVG